MTFNPHTDGDRVAMLEATGVNAVDEFFTAGSATCSISQSSICRRC